MSFPTKAISSLGAYSKWVEEVGKRFTKKGVYEAPWFRGAGDSRYRLVPGLYRTSAGREKGSDDELRAEFSRRALPLVAERAPRTEWEWYFLMQHYRAPTRLLDWTDSALVALYFALSSWAPNAGAKRGQPKPAVWVMNPFALNRRTRWVGPVEARSSTARQYLPRVYSHARIPQFPIALDPLLADQRMLVQHSHFTVHGSDVRGIDEMHVELGLKNGLFEIVVDLDADSLLYLRGHLALMGITETTVFPDLEGLARELRFEYDLDRP